MSAIVVGLLILLLIFLVLGAGIWVFVGLLLVSVTAQLVLLGFAPEKVGIIAARILLRSANSWELAAIPMFIWMGDLIFRTDISQRLFNGLAPLASKIPGRLLHVNVIGCTLFAAVCGSSTATTITVGKISLAELAKRGFDRDIAIGSLAGAGSLGLLIPPSIVMIVYGILAKVSIVSIFAAGVLPGLMIAVLYSGYIAIRASLNPKITNTGLTEPRGGPEKQAEIEAEIQAGSPSTPATSAPLTWHFLIDLSPVLALMALVLGMIYSGLATPSEAAAIGVAATLLIVVVIGQFSWAIFAASLFSAVRMSAMVVSLVLAAALLSTTMGYLRLPQTVATAIADLNLSPYGLIALLAVFYILLGMFLEGISITVMTLPITLPLVIGAGFDPIWFGIFLILMVELATITPPVGFNLFVLQGLTEYSIGQVARAAAPFFLLMCLGVVLLTVFPQIALWLPHLLMGR